METTLQDIRVLDFSRVLAGPFAAMLLGDLGAGVLKIERPGTGDDTRSWGPPFDTNGVATYFESVNRNKRSVVLDLSIPDGVEQARTLARSADIVIENFRPGLMAKFGLDYDALKAENPGLIYCAITGFGADAEHLPGYDLLVQALGGLMSITGSPDGPPHKAGVALVDVLAGLFATVGILAALIYRKETGLGQRLDIDLLSSLLAGLVNQATGYTAAGVVPTRIGNQHPSIAPYELLRTSDRDLIIAVGTDRQFAALCEALDIPELAMDPRFATNADRVAARHDLIERLESRLVHGNADDWALKLTQARVPAGVVNDIGGAFRLAEQLGLNPIVQVAADDGTAVGLTRNPIGLSVTPPIYRLAPPGLGSTTIDDLDCFAP